MNVSPPEGLDRQGKKYSPWIEDKEGRLMRTSLFKSLGFGLVVGCVALAVSACNTTKATFDTLVNFSSSTSPGELFTGDGLVARHQKVNLYTAIVFENLQQDMARGSGEYLASLGVLLDIPPDRQHEWALFTQSRYAVLFTSDRTKANEMLVGLTREFAATPNMSGPSRR
jgi:hypothetical protein